MKTATIVKIYPTAIWIESGFSGERRVMLQHEGYAAFCYATFHYNYAYTSNSSTFAAAHSLAVSLGAKEPVEQRGAPWPKFTPSLWQRIRAFLC